MFALPVKHGVVGSVINPQVLMVFRSHEEARIAASAWPWNYVRVLHNQVIVDKFIFEAFSNSASEI